MRGEFMFSSFEDRVVMVIRKWSGFRSFIEMVF